MKERLHVLGPGLFGIASLPEPSPPPDGAAGDHGQGKKRAPVMLLLNAGLMHRPGPFRIYVKIARRVAARGMVVVRLDHAGVGDGPAVERGRSYEDQVAGNVRAAMDALGALYETDAFILAGLCSGALESHRVAVRDARVKGIVLLDGYAYKTPSFYKDLVLEKARKPASWPGVATRVGGAIIHTLAGREGPPPSSRKVVEREEDDFFSGWPPLAEARRELGELVDRGVSALFVYTGGWSNFVADEQFDEMFPSLRSSRVRVHFLPHADHTYLVREHQESMLRAVEEFAAGFIRR